MSTTFVEGDLLLYFNDSVVYMVILDSIYENYFIVVIGEEGDYFYGRKIKIKNLIDKYFIKLDYVGKIESPHSWQTYDHHLRLGPTQSDQSD